RMKNGVQLREFWRIVENDCAKFFSVDEFVFAENFFAEFANHFFISRQSRFDEPVANKIGFKDMKTQFAQLICDPSLAAGYSSGEAKSPHKRTGPKTRHYSAALAADFSRRSRAALTVFDMSMVMVIGPTPPGTGVSAPAVLTASG